MEKKTFTINIESTADDMRNAAWHLIGCGLAQFKLNSKNENGVDIRIFECPHAEVTVIGEAFTAFAEVYLTVKQENEQAELDEAIRMGAMDEFTM